MLKNLSEGKEDLIDIESLLYVLDNRIDNVSVRADDKLQDLNTIFVEEAEIYLVGGQDIDKAFENMIERGNDLY